MDTTTKNGKRVIVGMSGGVDSAVAALLLLREGYDVTGVFMKNWDDTQDSECPAEQDFADVRNCCEKIGIPYYAVDFQEEYWDRVFSYFLDEYKRGRTPNPDVLCNREIKFRAFLDFAQQAGADYLATGHYARIKQDSGVCLLQKAQDIEKDQSYFLCLLKQEQLASTIFPLGSLCKAQVRDIARDAVLNVAEKKDSTGICFIGERKFKKFLSQYFPAQPGDIISLSGELLGKHDGLMYYTPGQRRGLDIGGKSGGTGERWFVVRKDLESNVLYVSQGEDHMLFSRALKMNEMNFISGREETQLECNAKIRYRQPDQKALLIKTDDGWLVEFEQKQRAVTEGQYCVLYRGDICLGGGAIDEVIL